MILGCHFLKHGLALGSKIIRHRKGFSTSVHAYQVRGDENLHVKELLEERNHQYPSSDSGKIMSAGEELPVTKDDAASVKRPQFGNRFLENPDNVFQHNAWDNVAWDPEQLEAAKKKVGENSSQQVETEKKELYEADADRYWNEFYSLHQHKFFKDRHWLFTEFPELSSDNAQASAKECSSERGASQETSEPRTMDSLTTGGSNTSAEATERKSEDCEHGPTSSRTSRSESGTDETHVASDDFPGKSAHKRILEVGCGVGNTIFPILQTNADPGLFVYGCDFSSVAVDIVRQHAEYNPSRCHAFVCDVSDPAATFPIPDNSLDLVVLIFVMSAINPDRFLSTIRSLTRLLKPGGRILFRDYGRYDLAQLRFKKGRCLSENFYVRGDGTRVYFFTQDELRELFTSAGLVEEQNTIDKRLQVNRGRQLTMYRVWIQCKYRKP
ncbi:methyltransferase-like protein 2 [Strongylocentrotus purpuratus]|uniref:Methyltransferase type 12 domain-containing protein n=1 Tax=Strongylocentrotus purpuratus TaxID=7668 RepID=A0A7M7R9F7_STRPU|nr:methyltransferase-like protein 2 [Strongylocentrotus purpuratus]